MPANPNTTQDDPVQTSTPPRLPTCPCCAGPLILLRGLFRCTRCQYSLCFGCESGGEGADGD